jgi:recombination protein RecR
MPAKGGPISRAVHKPSHRDGYPPAVANLIEQLAALPGIGPRAAERLTLHLLKSEAGVSKDLAGALTQLKATVRSCKACWNLTEDQFCNVCANQQRDAGVVLIVEQPRDLAVIEQAGLYKGVYHVLLGRLSPLDGVGADALTIDHLLKRVQDPMANLRSMPVREVILGLNPTFESDGTALYLTEALSRKKITLTRLARGLPTGVSLEMVNKAVLADALSDRTPIDRSAEGSAEPSAASLTRAPAPRPAGPRSSITSATKEH